MNNMKQDKAKKAFASLNEKRSTNQLIKYSQHNDQYVVVHKEKEKIKRNTTFFSFLPSLTLSASILSSLYFHRTIVKRLSAYGKMKCGKSSSEKKLIISKRFHLFPSSLARTNTIVVATLFKFIY